MKAVTESSAVDDLGEENGAKRSSLTDNPVQQLLNMELQCLQKHTRQGYEVKVEWLPGVSRLHKGRKLAEEVSGNTIFIYAEDAEEGVELIRHGFFEWLLNRHAKPYRRFINCLIEMFEEGQYAEKERVIESLLRLLQPVNVLH